MKASRLVLLVLFLFSFHQAMAAYYCKAFCKIYDNRDCGNCYNKKNFMTCGDSEDSAYSSLRATVPLDSNRCSYQGCSEDHSGYCNVDDGAPVEPRPPRRDGVRCSAYCRYYLIGNDTPYYDTLSGSGSNSISITQQLESSCRSRASSGRYYLTGVSCEVVH